MSTSVTIQVLNCIIKTTDPFLFRYPYFLFHLLFLTVACADTSLDLTVKHLIFIQPKNYKRDENVKKNRESSCF